MSDYWKTKDEGKTCEICGYPLDECECRASLTEGIHEELQENPSLTLDQVIERYVRMNWEDIKWDNINEEVLVVVWNNQDRKPYQFEEETYYPNDKSNIVALLVESTEKSKGYLDNTFWELRHTGLIKTEWLSLNRRRYDLASLTEKGLEKVKQLLMGIRSAYLVHYPNNNDV